jgi:hypothetical protein
VDGDPVAVGGRAHEPQPLRLGQAVQEREPLAEYDGMDREAVLVDEPRRGERAGERGAAEADDVLARLDRAIKTRVRR